MIAYTCQFDLIATMETFDSGSHAVVREGGHSLYRDLGGVPCTACSSSMGLWHWIIEDISDRVKNEICAIEQ